MRATVSPIHTVSALIAFLCALPIGVMLLSILLKITAIETAFKSVMTTDGTVPNTAGFVYMFIGLAALPVGLIISLWPMIRKDALGIRHIYIVNLILAVLLIALIIPTLGELAVEIYRCDVLGIPNCD